MASGSIDRELQMVSPFLESCRVLVPRTAITLCQRYEQYEGLVLTSLRGSLLVFTFALLVTCHQQSNVEHRDTGTGGGGGGGSGSN